MGFHHKKDVMKKIISIQDQNASTTNKRRGRASIYDEFTKATENSKIYNNYILKNWTNQIFNVSVNNMAIDVEFIKNA